MIKKWENGILPCKFLKQVWLKNDSFSNLFDLFYEMRGILVEINQLNNVRET